MRRSFRDNWDASRDDRRQRLHFSSGGHGSDRHDRRRKINYDFYCSDSEDERDRGGRRHHDRRKDRHDRRPYEDLKQEGRKDRRHRVDSHSFVDDSHHRQGRKRSRGYGGNERERSGSELDSNSGDDNYHRSSNPNRHPRRHPKDKVPHKSHWRNERGKENEDDNMGRRSRFRREGSPGDREGTSGQRPPREQPLQGVPVEDRGWRNAPPHGISSGKGNRFPSLERTNLDRVEPSLLSRRRPPPYGDVVICGRAPALPNEEDPGSLTSPLDSTPSSSSPRGLQVEEEDPTPGMSSGPPRSLTQIILYGVDLSVTPDHLCSMLGQLMGGELPWKVRRPAQEIASVVRFSSTHPKERAWEGTAAVLSADGFSPEGYLDSSPVFSTGNPHNLPGDVNNGEGILADSQPEGPVNPLPGGDLLVGDATTEGGVLESKVVETAPVISPILPNTDYNSVLHRQGLHDVNGPGGVVVLEFAKGSAALMAARLLNGASINGRRITASLH
ncbi:unnamed protein product [Phytomonas sp. EM1]|nr:unnamed protein product [Phytomonas sp. EM1]|eukprot:CCW64875.1 unnamed protein product [Phytomonas sp. isolate EM1]